MRFLRHSYSACYASIPCYGPPPPPTFIGEGPLRGRHWPKVFVSPLSWPPGMPSLRSSLFHWPPRWMSWVMRRFVSGPFGGVVPGRRRPRRSPPWSVVALWSKRWPRRKYYLNSVEYRREKNCWHYLNLLAHYWQLQSLDCVAILLCKDTQWNLEYKLWRGISCASISFYSLGCSANHLASLVKHNYHRWLTVMMVHEYGQHFNRYWHWVRSPPSSLVRSRTVWHFSDQVWFPRMSWFNKWPGTPRPRWPWMWLPVSLPMPLTGRFWRPKILDFLRESVRVCCCCNYPFFRHVHQLAGYSGHLRSVWLCIRWLRSVELRWVTGLWEEFFGATLTAVIMWTTQTDP